MSFPNLYPTMSSDRWDPLGQGLWSPLRTPSKSWRRSLKGLRQRRPRYRTCCVTRSTRSRKRSFLLTCGSILIYSIHDLYFILSVLQCPQEIEQCTWEFNLPTYLRLLDMVHAQIKVSTLASLASKLNLSRTNQHSAQQMFWESLFPIMRYVFPELAIQANSMIRCAKVTTAEQSGKKLKCIQVLKGETCMRMVLPLESISTGPSRPSP